LLAGKGGRGRQLNRAAMVARGDWLLFLHADCRLTDNNALSHGLALLKQAKAADGHDRTAAHFSLRFQDPGREGGFALFFCEAKARLDEPGCTHGDQGFLMSRRFFEEIGPFREDLPVMEDTSLAEVVRGTGRWLLLPLEIETSPRRFLAEGFFERQVLNALLMNFLFIGWDDFLQQAPAIYRQQVQAGRLQLLPFWQEINLRLKGMSVRQRLRLWYATGRYVRSQVWQLAFFREARRTFQSKGRVDDISGVAPGRFRAWFDPLTNHPPGNLLAGFLTWVWFYGTYVKLRLQRE